MPSSTFDYDDLRPVPFSREELELMIRSCEVTAYNQKKYRENLLEEVQKKKIFDETDCEQLIHHIDTEIKNKVLASSIAHRIAHCFASDGGNND
jgi:hypothetical protein